MPEAGLQNINYDPAVVVPGYDKVVQLMDGCSCKWESRHYISVLQGMLYYLK